MRERALSAEEQVLALATKRAVSAAGGLEVCSAETGLSTSQLSRCGSTSNADSLTIRDAATIDALTAGRPGAPFILRAQARLLGAIVIEGPGTVDTSDGVQAGVMKLAEELGDVSRSVSLAVADGKWTMREVDASLTELDELIAQSSGLVGTLMQIKRGLAA